MKYNQPYGITDPDAPYINGNPTTGTMGSIPPAHSIEHPQREIVNVIKSSHQIPDDLNTLQLALGIQGGQLIFADDQGVSNQVQVITSPNMGGAFMKGFALIVKCFVANTGPTTITINGAGIWPVVRSSDQSPLQADDITPGAMHCFVFDGVSFQLVWSARAGGGPAYLTGPRTYYINGNTGNDAWDGTIPVYTDGSHGPFKTLQRGANQIPLFNLNGWSINYFVADYNAYARVYIPKINGSGGIYWHGNVDFPDRCVVSSPDLSTIQCNSIAGTIFWEGFKIICDGPGPFNDGMIGILATGGGTTVALGAMEWGVCKGAHVSAQQGALLTNGSGGCVWKITGNSAGSPYLGGYFMLCAISGNFLPHTAGGPAIQIPNALNFGVSFIAASNNSFTALTYTSLTGAGATTSTGKRYDVGYNSSLNTNGGGPNYYPGNIAGTASTGGYYT